jgi:hypothetical protein
MLPGKVQVAGFELKLVTVNDLGDIKVPDPFAEHSPTSKIVQL